MREKIELAIPEENSLLSIGYWKTVIPLGYFELIKKILNETPPGTRYTVHTFIIETSSQC
jgi:hypothetical protein